MQRVPLGELPLEPFLAYEDPVGTKRPHSRGTPTPFSPAKRRILSEEGILIGQKSQKTPFPSARQSPSRFSQVLAGPASPARVLDFGMPKSYGGDPEKRTSCSSGMMMDVDSTPRKAPLSSSGTLAASPELKPARRNPVRSVRAPASKESKEQTNNPLESPSTPKSPSRKRSHKKKAHRKTTEIQVPRVPPATTAPDSIHYPGFEVYQDPYTIVYSTQDATDSCSSSSEMELDEESDVDKENVKPRRCVKGTGATLAEGMKSSKALKGPSSPLSTPRNLNSNQPSTPASTRFSRLAGKLSLASTPQASKKALRQALKDEGDLAAGEDSD